MMQLYRSLTGKTASLKPFHHIRVTNGMSQDLNIWRLFLKMPQAFSRPFIDMANCESALTLDWFTDAAKSVNKGIGRHHGSHWFAEIWSEHFLKTKDPSIEFLELYAVTVSVLLWSRLHQSKRIALFCDNESVVYMINKQSSKCPNCMTLIRLITLQSLLDNVRIYAKHVKTDQNGRADSLSRNKISKFLELSRKQNIKPDKCKTRIPDILTQIESWWIDDTNN